MSKKKDKPQVDLAVFDAVFDEIVGRVAEATGVNEPADLTLPGNPVSVGSRVPEAAAWADKMIERAGRASAEWLDGVLSPKKNPVEAAIAADGKRKQRLEEAEREGRWKKAMQQVDVDAMYEAIEDGGEEAYRRGIERRKSKIIGKIGKLRPLVHALAETIDKMPQDTDQQREERMLAARRGMIKIGKTLKGVPTK